MLRRAGSESFSTNFPDPADRLKSHVEDIAHAPRPQGSDWHERTRNHLIEALQVMELEPYGERFNLEYKPGFANVVGALKGSKRAEPPILLGAHYDTVRGSPGADDNAASIAVIIETVTQLKGALEQDLVVAFFDAEEPPHFLMPTMGSNAFVREQLTQPLHCALVLDLIGHDVTLPGFEKLMAITGVESDLMMAGVLGTAKKTPLQIVPTLNRYVGDMSDHGAFRRADVPFLFFSSGQSEHYHRPSDTPDTLNYERMVWLVDYLVDVVKGLDVTPQGGLYDSLAFELEHINKNVGLSLSSRAEIDALAYRLTNGVLTNTLL